MLSQQPFKFLALLSGAILIVLNSYAQTAPYIPNVFPPSPNAAALMKFTDVPVSPYTGTADVSVPIYTLQAKGISVPVSLSYHTGGIRLSEEASSTGLGWALNAGGMISRTVRDKDDLLGDYFSGNTPLKPGDLAFNQPANSTNDTNYVGPPFNVNRYCFLMGCSYLVYMASGDIADYSNAFSQASSGNSPSDLESDSYSYNFNGHSGKFIIKPDKTIVLEKQDNIRIKMNTPVGSGSPGTATFTITDDAGNAYYFNDKEYGGTLSDQSTLSSWHLTKIVTQQNDVVNSVTYKRDGYIPHKVPTKRIPAPAPTSASITRPISPSLMAIISCKKLIVQTGRYSFFMMTAGLTPREARS